MLQSVKNKQTLEILKKMRSGGAPNKMINSSGEMDLENLPEEENLNDIGFEMPDSGNLKPSKLQKKKKALPGLQADEDLAETADY